MEHLEQAAMMAVDSPLISHRVVHARTRALKREAHETNLIIQAYITMCRVEEYEHEQNS